MWKRKLKTKAVKFLWKRKHFKERSWKRMQTWKRLTLYGAGSGSKKYSTTSTFLLQQSITKLIYHDFIHNLNSLFRHKAHQEVFEI